MRNTTLTDNTLQVRAKAAAPDKTWDRPVPRENMSGQGREGTKGAPTGPVRVTARPTVKQGWPVELGRLSSCGLAAPWRDRGLGL